MNLQPNPMSVQTAAAAAHLVLTQMFGHLPAPYTRAHTFAGATSLHLQLSSAAAFEAWRSALNVPAVEVLLRRSESGQWLEAKGKFEGVAIHLTGFGIDVPAEPLAVTA